MVPPSTRPPNVPVSDRLLQGVVLGGIVLFTIGAGAGAFWSLQRIDTAVRESVRRNLTTVLATAREASRHWATRQQATAATIASSRELGAAVERLSLARARQLSTAEAIAETRAQLDPALRADGLESYTVVTDNGAVLLTDSDSQPQAIPSALQPSVDKALDGLPSLSSLADGPEGRARLVAMAPIRNLQGDPIAVLVIGLPTQREFTLLA